jgi:hypothetical protein
MFLLQVSYVVVIGFLSLLYLCLWSKNDLEMTDVTMLVYKNNVYHLILAGFRCANISTR